MERHPALPLAFGVMGKDAPFWQVNAFSVSADGGNPAGVILLEDWLDDAALLKIAEELGLPACAFAVKDASGLADWELRWFNIAGEIALCGHASLAAAHVLLSRENAKSISFRTRQSGTLQVVRAGNGYEISLPAITTKAREHRQAAALLGAPPVATYRSSSRHNIFLFDSEAIIRALEPAFAGLAALGNDQFICTALGDRADIVSRVFVPGGGANEDSVTGSAHAALAPFWAARLNRNGFTAHQASARGGNLTVKLDGERVWLGGRCVSVKEGVF